MAAAASGPGGGEGGEGVCAHKPDLARVKNATTLIHKMHPSSTIPTSSTEFLKPLQDPAQNGGRKRTAGRTFSSSPPPKLPTSRWKSDSVVERAVEASDCTPLTRQPTSVNILKTVSTPAWQLACEDNHLAVFWSAHHQRD